MATQPVEKTYQLTGGIISDSPLTLRNVSDIENMLATIGGGPGLSPREGITPLQQLTPTPTSGMTMWLVRLSEAPNRRLLVIQNARTKKIVKITDYVEQYGRLLPQIATGGADPIGDNDDGSSNTGPATTECEISFDAETYDAILGDTITVTVNRTGDTGGTVYVTYATGYNSGSSTTDFQDSSGVLTFNPGDETKTFAVISYDVGQSANKGGTINICEAASDDPLNTVTVVSPSITTLTFAIVYPAVSYARPSSLAAAVPVMMYAKSAGIFNAHYLAGFHGSTGTVPSTTYLRRVGPDHLAYLTIFGAGGSSTMWVNLYKISQMLTDGAAYSLGATSKGAAIKTQPYATVQIAQTFQVQITTSGHKYDRFVVGAYDETRFVIADCFYVHVISLVDGSVSTTAISGSSLMGNFTTHETSRGSLSRPLVVNPSGYIAFTVDVS